MHCPEHKTYTGKRIPKSECFSCWRLYTETSNTDVAELLNRKSTSEARASWLRKHIDDIIYAPLKSEVEEKETATATFVTPAKFVEEVEDDEIKPTKGVRI